MIHGAAISRHFGSQTFTIFTDSRVHNSLYLTAFPVRRHFTALKCHSSQLFRFADAPHITNIPGVTHAFFPLGDASKESTLSTLN